MTNTPRIAMGALIVTVGLLVVSCGSSSTVLPTAPTPGPAPATAAAAPIVVPGERWSLTTTFTSATGPLTCAVDISHMHVGESSPWVMTIERAGEAVRLTVSDLYDPAYRFVYDGTVVADVLTVPITTVRSAGWCGGATGGRVEFIAQNEVSGRFSADGRVLIAKEATSMLLTSGAYAGQTVGLYFDWKATPQ